MKRTVLDRVAKLGRSAAVKETGIMCRWVFHQPKAPRALLERKK